ncbi:hypothetical protein WN48_02510 [Eufriesea mexicana]|uniref:MADF domain-containing protein n=1 Tax=Eufriesea mexicana TaxID=516756 RepID=A0A310S4Q4_9HYME|nr:hypothetical protein WN48_02510 [Eufriesea mexicana]
MSVSHRDEESALGPLAQARANLWLLEGERSGWQQGGLSKRVGRRESSERERTSDMSTSDLVGYSHDFLTEFIQLYRSFPCLWQVRYKGYKDRLLRNRAYDTLVQKLREVNPIADRETVIRKINTLRTAFRREYKKVRSSQKMVQNPRQRYRSSLWYYDILKFVAEQNETSPLDEERDVKNALVNPADLSQEEMMSVQTDVDKIEPPSPVPSPGASSVPAFQPIILETEGSYARRISNSVSTDSLRRKYQQSSIEGIDSRTFAETVR